MDKIKSFIVLNHKVITVQFSCTVMKEQQKIKKCCLLLQVPNMLEKKPLNEMGFVKYCLLLSLDHCVLHLQFNLPMNFQKLFQLCWLKYSMNWKKNIMYKFNNALPKSLLDIYVFNYNHACACIHRYL